MTPPSASILPINFGSNSRRLFGILHAPSPVATPKAGVLLCNAFGQEAIRAHRVMRLLAERLARIGHSVLRFDYYGSGDSMGTDLDVDLDGWANDVLVADRELSTRAGTSENAWMGMRVGATVAMRAAQRSQYGPVRLVLWDPIIDGVGYLQHLRKKHIATLAESFSLMPKPSPLVVASDPSTYVDEAIGFALPLRMREQLSALTPEVLSWPKHPGSIVVVADPDDPGGRDIANACDATMGRVRMVQARHGIDWTTDSAESGALVPAAALGHLARELGGAE